MNWKNTLTLKDNTMSSCYFVYICWTLTLFYLQCSGTLFYENSLFIQLWKNFHKTWMEDRSQAKTDPINLEKGTDPGKFSHFM